MKTIGILGTGTVGQTFAQRLSELGYDVMIGTRDPKLKLQDNETGKGQSFSQWLAENKKVRVGTFAETAAYGEIVINVTQGANSMNALRLAGAKNMEGKVLIDVSNPLDFSKGMPPSLIPELSNTNSLGEAIQKEFPKTKVVKTLNTMWCGIMVNPKMIAGGDHTNYICGNDAEAKIEVMALLNAFGWDKKNILDLGDISSARGTEAVLPVWLRIWTATQNGAFNFKVVS